MMEDVSYPGFRFAPPLGFSPVTPSAYFRIISWYHLIEVRSITLNGHEKRPSNEKHEADKLNGITKSLAAS